MSDVPSYYRPFESDSESESASGSYYSDADASAEGPDFATFAKQLKLGKNKVGNIEYDVFDTSGIPQKPDSTFQDSPNVLIVDSRLRDIKSFPQPTFFRTRLPRTYRNVKSLQLVQINLLSAFFYFSDTKSNTTFPIYEEGRTTPLYDKNGNLIPNAFVSTITNIRIREGSYGITELLTEIQLQTNNVPLFFDFPNGFTDFSTVFCPTGDVTLNFNQPGDSVYDREHDIYINSPTMQQIANFYFQTNGLSVTQIKSFYTIDETRVAYYYPVLKELLFDTANPLSKTLQLLGIPSNKILHSFQGIEDKDVAAVINANLGILDQYRLQNTFLYRPVNQYTWAYETNNNRITVSSSNLNTSLVNLLSLEYNSILKQALLKYPYIDGRILSASEFTNLNLQVSIDTAVYNSMYRYLQTTIASNFAITYGTYSPEFYLNFSNILFLQNSCNLSKLKYSIDQYNNLIAASNIPYNVVLPTTSPKFWPDLNNLRENIIETTKPFVFINDSIVETQNYTTLEGYLNINDLTRSVDVVTDVLPATYTYFKFRSPVEQTLQVETLPRPLSYRYTNFNKQIYSTLTNQYFNLSYSFIQDPVNNQYMGSNITKSGNSLITLETVLINSPGKSLTDFINVTSPMRCYKYTAPDKNNPAAALQKFPTTFTILGKNNNSTFEDSFQLFIYHDFGAFTADILKRRVENKNHYKYNISDKNPSVTFNTVNGNTYYIIIRATNVKFSQINYTITVSSSGKPIDINNNIAKFNPLADPAKDPTNYNYAILYDPEILQLPSDSSLYTREPLNPLLPTDAPLLGANNTYKSNDLTDYRPYLPNSNLIPLTAQLNSIAIDPMTGFTFQYVEPYNSNTQQYLGNSENEILDTNLSIYNINNRQRDYKLVQWYSQTYISKQIDDPQRANVSEGCEPFNIGTTSNVRISGFDYDVDGNLLIGKGVIGFTLLPSDGIWNLEELWFKSAVVDSSDPNSAIKFIGIFYNADIYGKTFETLNLSNATCVLEKNAVSTYTYKDIADYTGGTYYQFINKSGQDYLYGYTQNSNTFLNDPNAVYCCIAFKDSNTPTNIYALAGTPVPYPDYSYPTVSNNYFGLVPPVPVVYINKYDVIYPTKLANELYPPRFPSAPPSLYVSQYEQSMPIITTGLLYLSQQQIITNQQALINFKLPIRADSYSFNWSNSIVINNQYLQTWRYNKNNVEYLPSFSSNADYTLTLDTIFPPWESQAFLSYCTDSSNMYFIGIQEAGIGPSAPYYDNLPERKIILKTFNPRDGQIELSNCVTPILRQTELLHKFFMNSNRYVFSTYDYMTSTSRYYINSNYIVSSIDCGHDIWCDPNSSNIYILPYNVPDANPLKAGGNRLYSLGINKPVNRLDNAKFYNIGQPTTIGSDIVINRYRTVTVDLYDNIYLLTPQYPNNFCQIKSITGVNTNIWTSKQEFTTPITSLQCGFQGSLWLVTNDLLYGAIQSQVVGVTPSLAYQIFYPCFKARFTKISNYINTTTDVNESIGKYPEYTHPQLFFYDNFTSFSNDCYGKFCEETAEKLLYSDTSASGYQTNSYIYNISLKKSAPIVGETPSADDYNYLAIRGYSPTEQFGCMTRFFLPERYDYGYTPIYTLINMIDKVSSEASNFNPNFSNAIINFNNKFIGPNIYGSNIISGYAGATITTTGFKNFMYEYSTLYTKFDPVYKYVNKVASYISTNLNSYINKYLSRILPPFALSRQNIQAPLPYTLGFKSGIPNIALSNALQEWGLAWNLGFEKQDYSGFTFYKAPSFYKILENYIYLQMNPEFNMNRIDTTGLENLALSRDPQGNVRQYAAKLLLTSFGSFTTSLVQNIANFNPPIERLDQLQFTWTDVNGTQINNVDCDWDASIQITESVEYNKIDDNRMATGFLKF